MYTMIENTIIQIIQKVVAELYPEFQGKVQLSTPQLQFGDFSSNIALILAKMVKKNPMEVAEQIRSGIGPHESIESIQVLK
ncbi:MAG: arginine--tRNA ligase, partial [Candidatus Roizmanbacteria bacterium]|nr:arginine--tRNA ligase [Candidatus Roizmanbacteria bacterium]